MRVIIALIVFVLSFFMAGVVYSPPINASRLGTGFSVWLLGFIVVNSIYFKYRFKTVKRFRYTLLKKFISINSFFKRIDTKVTYDGEDKKITPLQEKAVKLWKLCLRDTETNLSCSISDKTRHIEKNNLIIILTPMNQLDYLMTIVDGDDSKSCLYEIRIGSKLSSGVITSFDNENERRMKEGEEDKRKTIHSDLDKLLLQEENSLKKSLK